MIVEVIEPVSGFAPPFATDARPPATPALYVNEPKLVALEIPVAVTFKASPASVGSVWGAVSTCPEPVAATPLIVPATSMPVNVDGVLAVEAKPV